MKVNILSMINYTTSRRSIVPHQVRVQSMIEEIIFTPHTVELCKDIITRVTSFLF